MANNITKPLPDNEQFNKNFVQAVEKHPCLYDSTLNDYSNRTEQNKAWRNIAELFTAKASECKKRWRILRGGLTRYMKHRLGKSGCSTKTIKVYYLWDAMQFVVPFTKSREQSGNLPVRKTDEHKKDDDVVDSDDSHQDLDDMTQNEEWEHRNPQFVACNDSSSNPTNVERKRKITQQLTDDMDDPTVVDYLYRKRTTISENNPDLDFFKSILPDVALLTPSQKRKFKVMVLETLENFSNENNCFSSNYSCAQESKPTFNNPLD